MAFLVALVAGLAATPVAITVAHRTGVLDRPGPLKPQARPVAYLGGVAVGIAFAVAILVTGADDRSIRLLLPVGCALLLGLVDDVVDVPPASRLVCEVGIGVAAGWVAPATGGAVGWVVTAVLVVGLLNAVNLLDGLDGLAAGVGVASALGLAAIDGGRTDAALALAGALGAFLVFNRPRARIYLGDSGAYLLGTALAVLAASAVRADPAVARWAALPLLVAIPVADTAVAIVRRAIARRPLLQGDRSHTYDQLVDRGWSVLRVSAALAVAQAGAAGIAVGVAELSAGAAVAATVAVAAVAAAVVVRGGFLRPPT